MQDILYLSSLSPITIESSPSDLTSTFAKGFSDSPEFRRAQTVLSKGKYGLGQELMYQNLGKSFYDLPLSDNVKRHFQSLPGCNLLDSSKPLSLIDSIALLLSYNTFVDVRYLASKSFPLFAYVSSKKQIEGVVNKYPSESLSAILIPNDFSQE